MSEKYKRTCKYLNYVEHLLILVSTVTGCVSIFSFASLTCIPVGVTSSAVGIKICAITAGIKKHKSIIKKEEKNNKIVQLLKENPKTSVEYIKKMEAYCVRCKKITTNKNSSVRKSKQNRLMLLSNCAICGQKN